MRNRMDMEHGYEASVVGGYLLYRDGKGGYRIPIGRRGRRRLVVLDEKEGEYVRSLEIDLFTGFVYYCVDNDTSGGLSYYYDMASKKVGHYFIHRYLRNAKNHGRAISPQETAIFEKLPCEGWERELEKLPGWREAIEGRVEALLLPQKEVRRVSDAAAAIENSEETGSAPAQGARRQARVFRLVQGRDGRTSLRYANDAAGNEFFRQDEAYERILTGRERDFFLPLLEKERPVAEDAYEVASPGLAGLLRGFLRREVEIESGD